MFLCYSRGSGGILSRSLCLPFSLFILNTSEMHYLLTHCGGRVYIQRLGVGQRISEAPTLLLLGSRQSEGLVKFLIEHEDNTLYQNTAENPQKARDVPPRGRKELVEAPVLPLIVLYKTRDVLLGGCQIIVGGTCIIFSGLVSADGVEEEVWFHPSKVVPGHEHEIQPEAPGMARSAEKWLVPPEKAGDIIEVLRLRGGGGPGCYVREAAVPEVEEETERDILRTASNLFQERRKKEDTIDSQDLR
ncbi:hypothetical protein B0H14DRAFT_2593660 [Mycena olivaceomarginata]|nr:hypothetical protein B0H14DRAFT_2593660 [Mycena olivaceomarginata]